MENTQENPTAGIQTGRRKAWPRRLVSLFILGLVSILYFHSIRFKSPAVINVSTLNLRDLNGVAIPQDKLAKKAIILNYWAPWCGPCRIETPWLVDIEREHSDSLTVIGVLADDDSIADAKTFMASKGVNYPLARVSASLNGVVGTVGVLPTTFYISPSGRVLHSVNGMVPKPLMERYAQSAIESK
jgi:thiol-disulfide isomerase/thioredoxin